MTTYSVTTKNSTQLRIALSRLIEYADFLERDTGRNQSSYLKEILDEEGIMYSTEEYD